MLRFIEIFQQKKKKKNGKEKFHLTKFLSI